MKKILIIPLLFLFVLTNAQFTKSGSFLKTGSGFMTAPAIITIEVSSIDVFGTGGATTIATNGGTLQMLKKTLPTNAADTTVTWSGTNAVGTVSTTGLVTALTNGTVIPRATANDGSAVYGEEEITVSNQVAAPPSVISSDGHTYGWYISTDSVVQTGNAVRRWGDYLNSTHDLLQTTSANQPTWVTSGTGGIQFDGSADLMATASWGSTSQPYIIYAVVKATTWSAYNTIWCGMSDANILYRANSDIALNNGSWGCGNTGMAQNTWVILRVQGNGSSSKIQVNANTATTCDSGTDAITGFCLGGNNGGTEHTNICAKEIIIRIGTEAGADEASILAYLNTKYTVY
jgi:hypothetical protein